MVAPTPSPGWTVNTLANLGPTTMAHLLTYSASTNDNGSTGANYEVNSMKVMTGDVVVLGAMCTTGHTIYLWADGDPNPARFFTSIGSGTDGSFNYAFWYRVVGSNNDFFLGGISNWRVQVETTPAAPFYNGLICVFRGVTWVNAALNIGSLTAPSLSVPSAPACLFSLFAQGNAFPNVSSQQIAPGRDAQSGPSAGQMSLFRDKAPILATGTTGTRFATSSGSGGCALNILLQPTSTGTDSVATSAVYDPVNSLVVRTIDGSPYVLPSTSGHLSELFDGSAGSGLCSQPTPANILVFTSPDAVTWTPVHDTALQHAQLGNSGLFWPGDSQDGLFPKNRVNGGDSPGMVFDPKQGLFLYYSGASTFAGYYMTSPDGVNWTYRAVPMPSFQQGTFFQGFSVKNPAVTLFRSGADAALSTDDLNWTAYPLNPVPANSLANCIDWDAANGRWVGFDASIFDRYIYVTPDLVNFTGVGSEPWLYWTSPGALFTVDNYPGVIIVDGLSPGSQTQYTGIWASHDGGSTWHQASPGSGYPGINILTNPTPPGSVMNAVTSNGSRIVAVGQFAGMPAGIGDIFGTVRIMTSDDGGLTWQPRPSPADFWYDSTYMIKGPLDSGLGSVNDELSDVIYVNGQFVAVGGIGAVGGNLGGVYTSPDGIIWTAQYFPSNLNINAGNSFPAQIAYGNGVYVCAGAWTLNPNVTGPMVEMSSANAVYMGDSRSNRIIRVGLSTGASVVSRLPGVSSITGLTSDGVKYLYAVGDRKTMWQIDPANGLAPVQVF